MKMSALSLASPTTRLDALDTNTTFELRAGLNARDPVTMAAAVIDEAETFSIPWHPGLGFGSGRFYEAGTSTVSEIHIIASGLADVENGGYAEGWISVSYWDPPAVPPPDAPTPEPGALILVGAGLVALGWRRRGR